MSEEIEYERSSGNVFADLGFPDAETHLLKAKIVSHISRLIEDHGLPQAEAAERLDLDPAELSGMLRGRFRGFTVDQLLRMVNGLGNDVQIVISNQRTEGKKASLSIVAV